MKKALKILLVLGILTALFFIVRYFVEKSKQGSAEPVPVRKPATGTNPGTVVGNPIDTTEPLPEVDFAQKMKAGGSIQTFFCDKTGESITTANYQEYVNFVSKCQKAGGSVDQSFNGVEIEEIISSDTAFKTGDADSSDFAFMQLK